MRRELPAAAPGVPPLDLFVESLWACHNEAGPRRHERVLPSGAPQLVVVNLAEDQTRTYREAPSGLVCVTAPGSILSGTTSRSQIIDTDEQTYVAGVSFRPGGTVPFVALPADQLANVDVPLDAPPLVAGDSAGRADLWRSCRTAFIFRAAPALK